MKLIVEGKAKEIASLVLELQERLRSCGHEIPIKFGSKAVAEKTIEAIRDMSEECEA